MSKASLHRQVSCVDDHDPSALPVEEALQRIDALVRPVEGHETLALRDALGRILAEDICSPIDVPSHTNAAMDGYALAGDALPDSDIWEFKVVGCASAGHPYTGTVGPGECVRIMTGAPLPPGTDTTLMQEYVERYGDVIRVGPGGRPGENVRQRGEDLQAGTVVLQRGTCITPAELGLLASLGIAEVTLRRRVCTAFFSTGDELCSIGEALGLGEIYDSNRYTLYGMLKRLGAELIDMGVVRDRPEDLRKAFGEAARAADAVITSGGVSVGEADYTKEALAALGEVSFWKIAMKPGRPLAFGRIGKAAFFGLPGNPVSVMVTFYQFVQPALRRMMGEREVRPLRISVPCVSRLKKKPGRMEFQRGILEKNDEGRLVVRSTGDQGSGILSSMSQANAFIVLPSDADRVEPGTLVEVEPFCAIV
jgi:molybdenum cofactor synthesis domain